MELGSGVKTELWWSASAIGVSLVVGLIFSHVLAFFCLALLVVLVRLFYLINILENWSGRVRRLNRIPNADLPPIWSELSYNIETIFVRHRKKKARLQKVVERVQRMGAALSDGVVLLDKHERIEWWNAAAEDIFGFRRQDIGHKSVNMIRHPRFVQYFESKDFTKPLELSMWQRQVHLEIKIHPFGEGEYLLVVRDITRLYKLELMRKDFVANVSHELRTPLTVIRGYVETLADCDLSGPWSKAFGQMEQQCHRMDVLISDLITLSKLETSEKEASEEVHLAELLNAVVKDVEPLSGSNPIAVDCRSDVSLKGNEKELRSAFSNLIVNAINYSGEGVEIQVSCEVTANEVVIKVKDGGVGIDPKHLPRLTERFYRVDSSRSVSTGGTGLGLAIVKHVLLRHNARLQIESKLGFGSTFACHFPKVRKELVR